MAYLEEFRNQLQVRNYQKVLNLWEEYCLGESAEPQELAQILCAIKQSEFARPFSAYALQILPQVLAFKTFEEQVEPLKALYDIQVQDSAALQEIAITFLKKHFEQSPNFSEKLRLVGLRGGTSFQGAIANFILLNHLEKNNFVLHTAGWGVGEIVDVSFVREQATIEFENLKGNKRDISFKNAFKTLLPLSKSHFLARRFADPDQLEKEAKENPAAVVRLLLQGVGPKSAAEIKNELENYVIPEKEYSKWWQGARAKLKKDPLLDVPENTKEAYRLRKGKASLEDRLEKAFSGKHDFYTKLAAANSFIRDFPEVLKNEEAKQRLVIILQDLIGKSKASEVEEIQVLLFMENALGMTIDPEKLKTTINNLDSIDEVLRHIEILSLKKRFLDEVRDYKNDWKEQFQKLLFVVEPNQLKDYILKELSTEDNKNAVEKQIGELILHPKKYPEALLWYFNKIVDKSAPYFCSTKGRFDFLEAYLILLHHLEQKAANKEIVKKMANLLLQNRFSLSREFLKESTEVFAKEFLLLVAKCHTFTDHDKKIFQSLAEVVHPNLAGESKQPSFDYDIIWTTAEGFEKVRERIQHIGTKELIDVANEIKVARGHGDLRENAEFKSAQERRSRLQSELKHLSHQFQKARVITPDDIRTDEVSIGSTVSLQDAAGNIITYTILGPWDADIEQHILSFQSKLAQEMIGKKMLESFSIKDETYKIVSIASYLVR